MENKMKDKKKSIISDIIGKIKISDAGEKYSSTPCCVESSSSKNKVYYPSLYLDVKQAPDLKGYDVEDVVYLLIEGKIVGHNVRENSNMSKENFDIEIKKIGCSPKNKK